MKGGGDERVEGTKSLESNMALDSHKARVIQRGRNLTKLRTGN